jgi:cytochrome P450
MGKTQASRPRTGGNEQISGRRASVSTAGPQYTVRRVARLGGGIVTFDIAAAGRPPHLAFGGGVHYCLGHLVARADMSVALAVLARRLREPRVCGDAVWLPCSGNTGPSRLPLAFTPGR